MGHFQQHALHIKNNITADSVDMKVRRHDVLLGRGFLGREGCIAAYMILGYSYVGGHIFSWVGRDWLIVPAAWAFGGLFRNYSAYV